MDAFARRSWDVLVGAVMVALGLAIQLVFCGLLGMFIAPLLPEGWYDSRWTGPAVVGCLMLLVNVLAFYDFYRRRRVNTVYSTAGRIHLVPRGFARMCGGGHE